MERVNAASANGTSKLYEGHVNASYFRAERRVSNNNIEQRETRFWLLGDIHQNNVEAGILQFLVNAVPGDDCILLI